MDKIQLHNYEAFFLDYIEGKLDQQGQKELEKFLNIHPELRSVLKDFENIQLGSTSLYESFPNKKLIKRDEQTDLSYVDTLLIASIEGILTNKEAKELDRLLNDPKILTQLTTYKKVKLRAEAITYPKKHLLKRKQIFSLRNSLKYAAAAAIIFSVFFFNQTYEGRYELRSLQLPMEENLNDFKLELPVYSSTNTKIAKEVVQKEVIDLIETNPIIAEIKQIPPQGPRKLKSNNRGQMQPQIQQNMTALNNTSKQLIEEGNNSLKEDLAFESLEYSKLPSLLLDMLNKNILDEQVNFIQEKGMNGRNKSFALNIGVVEISHSKGN